MDQTASLPLSVWESFYVIVGCGAGAMTGLQFVVIVLASEVNALGNGYATRAFATPTVVHFCAVLVVSCLLSAPWHGLTGPAIVLSACGSAGILYTAMVVRTARRQTEYTPVLEDWIFHGALPLLAYVGLVVFAVTLTRAPERSLFAIGTAAVMLMFVGIHNAWDAVIYIAHRKNAS